MLRPDKRSGVVIMDKLTHKSKMYELLNDESKFKQLTSDPTKLREGQLQRYLRKLNNKAYFDESIYDYIYPEVLFTQDSLNRSYLQRTARKIRLPSLKIFKR